MIEPRRGIDQQPSPKKKERKSKRRLETGQIVKSKAHNWCVVDVLGSGGFGEVYKVTRSDTGEAFAMKTEYNDPKKRKTNDRLKVEMAVFSEFHTDKHKHFLKLVDRGQTEAFKYIVMTMVSHSLDILRRDYLDTMTWTTIFNISLQTLEAIEDLHSCGFLHRDIKPHNFAIGMPPKDTTIFMIDFGISRRYVDKDGKLRIPRQSVRFLGTVRFASRSCHNEREQSRKDDLESWLYMVLDLFNPDNITWRRVADRAKVAICKHQLVTRTDGHDIDAPKELLKVVAYVNEMGYADVPDYARIREHLHAGAKDEKLDLSRAFDWVGVELKKKPNARKAGPMANHITDDDEETSPSRKKKKDERRRKFSMELDDQSSTEEEIIKQIHVQRKTHAPPAKSPSPSKPMRVRRSHMMLNPFARSASVQKHAQQMSATSKDVVASSFNSPVSTATGAPASVFMTSTKSNVPGYARTPKKEKKREE